jgi:hypothetical protein
MSRQSWVLEIAANRDKVWNLLADPKEFAFWAPNVRDLTLEPTNGFDVDTVRHFRLDVSGKIETLETRLTHCIPGEMFAEIPVGGSLKLHDRVEHMKMVYRVESTGDKTCNFMFTIDWEMKGFMNKMLEKMIIGTFTSQLKLWFERMQTYAETGRPV